MRGRSGSERHLDILHTVAETVSRSLDVEDVVRTALDALTHVTGHEISSLPLLSEDGRTLQLSGDRGLSPELREINRVLTVGEGLIGGVAATGQTLNVRNAAQSPDLLPAAKRAGQKGGQRGRSSACRSTAAGVSWARSRSAAGPPVASAHARWRWSRPPPSRSASRWTTRASTRSRGASST